ncbi:MAG TPA: cupin domain-containing protein [Chloroflexota bacterium]
MSFYEEWLDTSKRVQHAVENAPALARGANLKWIETPQDYRIAMLIGEQVGFPTMGTSLMKAEIPAGHHSGKHQHGEEGMHFLSGTGFSVIDGRRYDWKPGTTLHIPFMSEHQHFNTGSEPAMYVSAMSIDLDLFVKLGRLIQLEEKGKNAADVETRFGKEASQYAEDGRRIALHAEDWIDENAKREEQRKAAEAAVAAHGNGHGHEHHGHDHGHGHEGHGHGVGHQGHRHGAIYILMGGSESLSDETNGFQAKAVAITNIFEETPKTRSHSHTHTEAMLYVLEGSGYSEVDGKRYDWVAGDAVHVPPKMTMHEHFNNSEQRTRTLRIEFGARYFYEALWQGFHKVEHRLTAEAIA